MANSQTHCKPRRNLLSRKDEPAGSYIGALVPTERSGTPTHTTIVSCTSTPAPTLLLDLTPVILMARYIDKYL